MYRCGTAFVCSLLFVVLQLSIATAADDRDSKSTSGKTLNWTPFRPGQSAKKDSSAAAARESKSSKSSDKLSDKSNDTRDIKIDIPAIRVSSQPPLANTAPSLSVPQTFAPQTFAPNVPSQIVLPQTVIPTLQPADCPQPYMVPQFPAPPPPSRFWVRGEYLYWRTLGAEVPPLVTAGGTGVLGQPGTTVLFGGNELNDEWHPGGRLSAGIWLNPTQATGIEGNVFALQEDSTDFQSAQNAPGFIARPFFNIQIPAEDARLVPGPGFTAGGVAIHATTQLQGGELLLRQMINSPGCNPVAFLVGYRYLHMEDNLFINEAQSGPGPAIVTLFDSFDTENTFQGVNVGVITELRRNRWTLELLGKIALGNTHSEVTINGATTTAIAPGAPATTIGGLLAQSSNIGTYQQDDLSVVPELGATLGFDITDRLRLTAGYTFLYWSRVARAGDQIDRDVNLPLVPGPNTLRPEFAFQMTDFWAQGASVGLEYAF